MNSARELPVDWIPAFAGMTDLPRVVQLCNEATGSSQLCVSSGRIGAGEEAGTSNRQKTRPRYSDRIVRDRRICGGQAVFKGTRVTLRTVLASLADGDSIEVILRDFPCLKRGDVRAAIAFAAACAVGNLPRGPLPRIFDGDQT